MKQPALINFQNFIIATRDSGYKNTASALAEVVDNAIEAGATKVEVKIIKPQEESGSFEVHIIDNGKGMTEGELCLALQFGGSSRFGSRKNFGRYGMGLPNSSLSQCRRVEVITWKTKRQVICNHLDVDEVIEEVQTFIAPCKTIPLHQFQPSGGSGTVVKWLKCDRLSFKYVKTILKHIHLELGRIFRYHIWNGTVITVGGENIIPVDPLYLHSSMNPVGGIPFGETLTYPVRAPGRNDMSEIKVRFIELPVEAWAKLSIEEKKRYQITKNAGVSVLRAGREIDYGWFFMGEKRKENYDDWWRCEISFTPELDEIFGVTHTKQEIRETEYLKSILVPDFEQTARTLNNRVRLKFVELKKSVPTLYARPQLEKTDIYLPPLKSRVTLSVEVSEVAKVRGLGYEIVTGELKDDLFYDVKEKNSNLILTVNTKHIFFDKVFKALHDRKITAVADFIRILEVIMFSAGRSEYMFAGKKNNSIIDEFKMEWSSQLKTFIS